MSRLRSVAAAAGVLCVICGWPASTPGAAVFRCTVEGRALYTDLPCRAGEAPHALPRLGVMPAGDQADLATAHDARRQRLRDAREADDAAWLGAHASRQAQERRMEEAIRQKRAAPGMSADQLRRALGRPDRVERDRDGEERWSYRAEGGRAKTVRLRDGKVVGRAGPGGDEARARTGS
jgi:hypothetical protein